MNHIHRQQVVGSQKIVQEGNETFRGDEMVDENWEGEFTQGPTDRDPQATLNIYFKRTIAYTSNLRNGYTSSVQLLHQL